MGATAQLGEQGVPFDPTLLMAGFDACPEGLAIVESGRILYANRAFGKTRAVADREWRGKSLTEYLPQSTRYIAEKAGFADLSGELQIEALTSNFQERQRTLQIICIRFAGMPGGSDTSMQESRKMEAIGRLSATFAHDLNNLLTGIMLYAELLVDEPQLGSRFRRHAEAIHKAGTDGISLIQQLMIPSREEAMPIPAVSWNQIASEMVSLLTRLVGENIEIETKLAEPIGQVRMEPSDVRRIMLNLILNARYAMPNGGKITLSSRNCAVRLPNSKNKRSAPIPCVEFSVRDDGAGMDRKTLAQVFRPFFTTKPRSQGSGLGLTIVRDIVEQANGEVEIESELGKGTQVTIRVPRIAEKE